jgi:hypothetical protein
MKNESVETYLKSRVNDLLNRVEKFEKRIFTDREEFMKTREVVKSHKKSNPSGSYEDVKSDLIRLMDLHYYSFLMEQNLQHILNTLIELNTMSNIFDIDLGLDENKKEAMKNISNQKSDIFIVNDSGDVVFSDEDFKKVITEALETRKASNDSLKEMYENLQ